MTILVKKVFISSKPTFVYLLCPPLCGPFSIQESAAGGLSYKVKKVPLPPVASGAPVWNGTSQEDLAVRLHLLACLLHGSHHAGRLLTFSKFHNHLLGHEVHSRALYAAGLAGCILHQVGAVSAVYFDLISFFHFGNCSLNFLLLSEQLNRCLIVSSSYLVELASSTLWKHILPFG